MRSLVAGLGLALIAQACASPAASENGIDIDGDGKEDSWNAENDPTNISANLERRLERLPTGGRAREPARPSSYFPTAEDGINHRWNAVEVGPNGYSPAEK